MSGSIYGRISPINPATLPSITVHISRPDHTSVTYGNLRVYASTISSDRASVCVRAENYDMIGEVIVMCEDSRQAIVEAVRTGEAGLRGITDYAMIGRLCDELREALTAK